MHCLSLSDLWMRLDLYKTSLPFMPRRTPTKGTTHDFFALLVAVETDYTTTHMFCHNQLATADATLLHTVWHQSVTTESCCKD